MKNIQDTPSASRFVVGFDLGTTNSAVTYVDTAETPWRIQTFSVPQLVAPGQIEARETLPSFHYQSAAGEFPPGAFRCPWHTAEPDSAVGFFARDHGMPKGSRQRGRESFLLAYGGGHDRFPVMPRRLRVSTGEFAYHVLNRAAGRMRISARSKSKRLLYASLVAASK